MNLPEKQIQHVDLPELSETFSDSIRMTFFDGHTARIEFCVTRMDPPKPPGPPTAHRYPCCRLVLTPQTVFDLANQLQPILKVMEEQGIIKRIQTDTKSTTH
jgi:hypothetical protein